MGCEVFTTPLFATASAPMQTLYVSVPTMAELYFALPMTLAIAGISFSLMILVSGVTVMQT